MALKVLEQSYFIWDEAVGYMSLILYVNIDSMQCNFWKHHLRRMGALDYLSHIKQDT